MIENNSSRDFVRIAEQYIDEFTKDFENPKNKTLIVNKLSEMYKRVVGKNISETVKMNESAWLILNNVDPASRYLRNEYSQLLFGNYSSEILDKMKSCDPLCQAHIAKTFMEVYKSYKQDLSLRN